MEHEHNAGALDAILAEAARLSGRIEAMPARVRASGVPDDVDRARRAIAGTNRLLVVRYLAEHPGATSTDIIAGTGVATESVRSSIKELTELGYVTITRIPRRHQHYIDVDQLATDLHTLIDWVLRREPLGGE